MTRAATTTEEAGLPDCSGQSQADGAAQSDGERLAQLYAQTPLGIGITLLVASLATVTLWEQQMRAWVLFWWFALLLIGGGRVLLYWAYRRARAGDLEAPLWRRRLGISAFGSGAVWGFAAAVFFPANTVQQQVFLALLLSGLVSGGIPMYPGSWRIYAVYAAAILAPFTVVLAMFGDRLFGIVALLVPLFFAINVWIAYRLGKVFGSGFRLRQEYGKLTNDYADLNLRLEHKLRELESARQQVEASGRKLTLFAERSPIAVLELDARGRVLNLNGVAENLFGYAAREMIGRQIASYVFAPRQRAIETPGLQEIIRTHQTVAVLRQSMVRRDGQEIICEWSLTPLVNAEGQVLAIIMQGRDVTRQLETDRLKQEFTSTLSHELRTPLTSIIGALQLVSSGVVGQPSREIGELTRIAERNSQRLLELINDLLDIESMELGNFAIELRSLALDEVVRESLELNQGYAERHGTRLTTAGELLPVRIKSDRKRLLQVMTNLLSNAAKFAPEDGTVEVSMHDHGPRVRIAVHDRGPGIPESFRERVFTRFAQADMSATRGAGGTGLGLAICKRLVELMGGRIGFEDRDGGGTTFWFELAKHPE